MKIALCFAVLVLAYIIYSTNAQLSVKSTPQRRSQPRSQQRSLFIKSRRNRRITNLLKVPSIICYYAKYGKWPEYDQILQSLVLQFSQIVFAMNDESIRFYCNQVYKFNQFFRPLARPREATTTIFPNRNFQTIAINFGTLPPTTSSFITSTLAPTTTRTTATLRPLTNVLTTPTTTIRPNGLTTITSTTTTTAAPSASGTGTGTGTGTATGTGTGSASGSATGTATAGAASGTVAQAAGAPKAVKRLKAANGDIVVAFPGRLIGLRQIGF